MRWARSIKGALASRPDDEIALAFGSTHINDRLAEGEALHNAAEPCLSIPCSTPNMSAELDYRAMIAQGAEVSPNLQYIVDPGGVAESSDIAVMGLKTTLTF